MSYAEREIRFGTLAVEMGFVTGGEIGKAVSMQMKEDLAGLKHRFIGEILVDLGFMSPSQIEEVIQEQKRRRL